MKIQIDTFIVKTLTKKLGLFLAIVIIVSTISIAYAISSSTVLYQSYISQKEKSQQISDLKQKIQSLSPNTVQTLQDSKDFVETFLPAKFDLFSTVGFIDAIGRRSGFKVGSLNISEDNLNKDTLSTKSVTLTADMTFDEFFDFLKQYKYSSSRILDVGAISVKALKNQNINLTATIYTYDPTVDLEHLHISDLDASDRKALESMKEYASTQKQSEASISDSYTNREDPFQ
ncbi:MAG: hypothetical protein NUV65_01520 [Candidatus Roizmanbacteria bacterium]|nr:hypothetical protein [Candidatus Roizmanbacteria bacterium]